MPDYFDDPAGGGGRVRIPDELADPRWADSFQATPRGREVEMMFMRVIDEGMDPEADTVVAEVVARVFMDRKHYETLVGGLAAAIEEWRRRGL